MNKNNIMIQKYDWKNVSSNSGDEDGIIYH